MTKKLVVADIGGTNSRFAFFQIENNLEPKIITSKWLETKKSLSFSALLSSLEGSDFPCKLFAADFVVIAAAGPVEEGVYCKPPLITWDIDMREIQKQFGVKAFFLINDFLAQAYACRSPIGKNARLIVPGEIAAGGTVAVIGAGTGLGKAFLLPDGQGGFVAGPSEGGHVNFAAETEEEIKFADYLCRKLKSDYVTWNDIVCGRGLTLIHEFLEGKTLTPEELTPKLKEYPKTLAWGASFYGRVSRNFALETLALGGVYIAGGIAARNPELVEHPLFQKNFRASRVYGELLAKIPVYLISDQESGLWGAAFAGWHKLRREVR